MLEKTSLTNTNYAGFNTRLAAHLIDVIILGGPVLFAVFSFIAPFFIDLTSIDSAKNPNIEFAKQFYQNGIFISLSGAIGIAAVAALFINYKWQATPGKRLMGIYIISSDGSKPSYLTAFQRFVSLPLAVLLIQIFQRNEIYGKLAEIKSENKVFDGLADFEAYINGPISDYTSLAVLVLVACWYSRIFLTTEKTAFHDILFNTRVVHGKV